MDIKSEKIKNEDLVYIKEIDRGAFGVVYQGL